MIIRSVLADGLSGVKKSDGNNSGMDERVMKVAIFKGAGRGLAIEDRPIPIPKAGEVLVRVHRVGVCGSDLHATEGDCPLAAPGSILGHEFCGEVVALGPGVTRLKVSDRVAPMPFVGCGSCVACLAGRPHHCPRGRYDVVSGFSQYSRAGQNECIVLPEGLSDEAGALIEPLAVGLQGVRKANFPIDARVLITGAGPIGLATAFWARRLGAGAIAVMARSRRREGIAATLGADHFIAQQDTADAAAAVNDALGGPPDVVFEAAGVPGAIADAIGFVKPEGTVVSLGFSTKPETFIPTVALWKEIRLLFSLCYDRQDFQYTAGVMAAGDLRPLAMITGTVKMDALPERFARLLDAKTSDCKVMVSPWDD